MFDEHQNGEPLKITATGAICINCGSIGMVMVTQWAQHMPPSHDMQQVL